MREKKQTADGKATAVGSNSGRVSGGMTDKKKISGNNFNNLEVSGNVTINNTSGRETLIIVICVTAVAVMLLLLVGLFICKSTDTIRELPPRVNIQIGPRGGVYYIDTRNKRRVYLDRKRGVELYRRQQETLESRP